MLHRIQIPVWKRLLPSRDGEHLDISHYSITRCHPRKVKESRLPSISRTASEHWPPWVWAIFCQRAGLLPPPRPSPYTLPAQNLAAWLVTQLLGAGHQASQRQKAKRRCLRRGKLLQFLEFFACTQFQGLHLPWLQPLLHWSAERTGHGHVDRGILAIHPAADGDVGGGCFFSLWMYL